MKRLLAFAVLFVLAGGMVAYADIVSYNDPAHQGTQTFGGNLALTFNVNSPVTIDALGVFNASGTGVVTGPIQVVIYDTTTNQEVTPVVTFSGTYTPAALGYDVFQSITPVVLGPGSYEVDAVGFGSPDSNGNLNTGSSSGPMLNNFGGALTFTGAAWDYSGTLDDPTTCSTCQPMPAQASQFDAGTFSVVPDASFYEVLGVLGVCMAGFLFVVRRRRSA